MKNKSRLNSALSVKSKSTHSRRFSRGDFLPGFSKMPTSNFNEIVNKAQDKNKPKEESKSEAKKPIKKKTIKR